MAPFIIYALPRSRTYWLKHYLTYGDWYCGHDELRHARSMDDIHNWLTMPCTGTVETAAAPFWRSVCALRTVTIRRPVDDVVRSMQQFNLNIDWDIYHTIMLRFDRKLDQIEHRIPDVMSIHYDDLNDEATCAKLFEFCLPYAHDPVWYQQLAPINIQCHMGHYLRYAAAFQQPMNKLAQIAKFHTLQGMNKNFPTVDQDDGLTIGVEPFHAAFEEAMKLAPAHCVVSGEAPDQWQEKNWELIADLAARGNIQCVIARSNGRMFGYLMTMISPSIEKQDIEVATHTAFFADTKNFKNLGIKMQRAAIDALKQRGVSELYLRAGVRADGPRMGILYKRLGAKPHGEWFKLDL
jgi:GNAT superfamily N-acetyltransferase